MDCEKGLSGWGQGPQDHPPTLQTPCSPRQLSRTRSDVPFLADRGSGLHRLCRRLHGIPRSVCGHRATARGVLALSAEPPSPEMNLRMQVWGSGRRELELELFRWLAA